jgi:hypothetical protein
MTSGGLFGISDFEFVSDFEFRISNFGFRISLKGFYATARDALYPALDRYAAS